MKNPCHWERGRPARIGSWATWSVAFDDGAGRGGLGGRDAHTPRRDITGALR